MKVLIDTNIVLDLILEREPFVENAIALFEQIEQGNLEGYIVSQFCEVHQNDLTPSPFPESGRGVRIKASLLVGERFGERSECTASNREPLYIAATTITNIFYIIRKTEGREVALAAIDRLLTGLRFCAVDRQTVETALSLSLKDFEDSIQLACATLNQLDAIVTRDQKDFIGSNLPIYSPTELLNQI